MARIKLSLLHTSKNEDEYGESWSTLAVFLIHKPIKEFRDCEYDYEKSEIYDDLCQKIWGFNLFSPMFNGGVGMPFAGSVGMFFRQDCDGLKLICHQSGGRDI